MSKAQSLVDEANKILTTNGFDWNGKPIQPKAKAGDFFSQLRFERSHVKSPCGGQHRKR